MSTEPHAITGIDVETAAVSLYPVWRQAAAQALAEFDYGDTIPLAWIREHLEIEEPAGLLTVEQHRQLQFDLLQKVENFKAQMLEEHKRLLISVRSVGYKIVEPPHQTDAAMRRFQREFRKSLQQAMAALIHIDESALTLEDARDNADAKAKMAYFKAFGNKHLEKPKAIEPSAKE